jgi:nicotinate-nucleotide adenylyltransferase
VIPHVGYGGTFDPVHAGHLAVARAARAALGADIAFVPAADPPHRPPPGADARHRAAMLARAIAGEPGFSVDRRELERDGPSWSVVTLAGLRAELGPGRPLVWLVGADAFRGLPTWHRWTELLGLAHFVVAVRPDHALEPLPAPLAEAIADRFAADAAELLEAPAGRVWVLAMPPHPASSTRLRERLRAGQDPGDWLPAAVAAYIARHGLYTGDARGPGV